MCMLVAYRMFGCCFVCLLLLLLLFYPPILYLKGKKHAFFKELYNLQGYMHIKIEGFKV